MIRFECDYLEGAHPQIIEALAKTNLEQAPGYGTDRHCENARSLIRQACNAPEADVHFLVGGTQTNTVVISSILRPHQGVICADTGHINVHETGAIEAVGHKVLPIKSTDGKLSASQIETLIQAHFSDADHEHIVQPGMVYLSQPTENGTLYTKEELTKISLTCRAHSLPLYVDGARLGYGLASPANNISLPELASLCDAFYIGGTKVGALFGEAVVLLNPALKQDFRYLIKQKGGMLAKGRLLGIQFETLFTDALYFEISKHAVSLALTLKEAFVKKGIPLLHDSFTNQQFPILKQDNIRMLEKSYSFSLWSPLDGTQNALRFCTSWATPKEHVEKLCRDIQML